MVRQVLRHASPLGPWGDCCYLWLLPRVRKLIILSILSPNEMYQGCHNRSDPNIYTRNVRGIFCEETRKKISFKSSWKLTHLPHSPASVWCGAHNEGAPSLFLKLNRELARRPQKLHRRREQKPSFSGENLIRTICQKCRVLERGGALVTELTFHRMVWVCSLFGSCPSGWTLLVHEQVFRVFPSTRPSKFQFGIHRISITCMNYTKSRALTWVH